jgi:hypothetical protein
MNSIPPSRLIPLSDGRPGLRSLLQCDVTTPAEQPPAPCLDFVSSDATLDRYGEIISPEGWDLSTYQKNPVFQNSHQYGDIIHTLGKALITEVRTDAQRSTLNPPRSYLFQRIQFATDANPIARIAYPLYAHGYLRAVSVGFIPLRWQDNPDPLAPGVSPASGAGVSPASAAGVSPGPSPARIYLHQELIEVSAVAIPANPSALALAIKSGAVPKSDLQDTADLIRHALTHTTTPPPEHPLILLAHQVREQLKHL